MCLPPILYSGTTPEFVAFFGDVADAAQLPIVIYNNPEASGIDLPTRRSPSSPRRCPP